MKPVRSWTRFPGRVPALVFAVAAVSVLALLWLGLRLLDQDRALEEQRLRERREDAADRLVAALEQALSVEERKLADLPRAPRQLEDAGAIRVLAEHGEIQVWPDRALLYYPLAPGAREPPTGTFLAADQSEFVDHEYERAVEILGSLAGSRDPAVRAAAQLRLARNLRKAGRPDAALRTYDLLATTPAIILSGVPSELVARAARCALLEDLRRSGQLRQEAGSLHQNLTNGRWRLDRATYLHYSGQVPRWLGFDPPGGAERQALADAVSWLWENSRLARTQQTGASGRQCVTFSERPIAVVWRASADRVAALVADPEYQRHHWWQPVLGNPGTGALLSAVLDGDDRLLYGAARPAGFPQARRAPTATGLPWTVVVANSDLQAEEYAERRRLLTAALVALALLVAAASYLIGRTVSRELAVARLQSDFVSAVSHEFRTPLTSLRQFTEMLVEDDTLPSEKRSSYHQAQERATRRLSRLVESLLDFGRMEAGARPYRFEPLDAAEVAAAVVEEFRQEAAGTSAIECKPAPGPAPVRADREALAQALWNLLDNAVKYSGGTATVLVEVERAEGVAIRVRDRGPGIPSSEQAEIFRKFARGSSAREHHIKGTGIGLAMVKHIVEAHAGTVTVESEPGRGSIFTIHLPAGG